MPDTLSKSARSLLMSRVRSRGNVSTELRVVALLREHRISGWRRNWPLFGRPDFVFPRHRLALFVDGCFWHACPKHSTVPKSNRRFWLAKRSANRARDKAVNRRLRSLGWRVLRVWEHDLSQHSARTVRRIRTALLTQ